jgi:nicotinate-nucleotide adenylyltransferase
MKIGVYGGSFNPIHFGHIGLAEWVVNNTDLDEVWLMLSPNNPLKDKSILADEQERLAAAKEAIAESGYRVSDATLSDNGERGAYNDKRIVVSDFEFHLPRPTYTANTLRALTQEYPQHEFTLIIGEDNLAIFDKWREYQYILDNYRILVYPRHGYNSYPILTAPNLQVLSNAPYFDISSTEIRNGLREKK